MSASARRAAAEAAGGAAPPAVLELIGETVHATGVDADRAAVITRRATPEDAYAVSAIIHASSLAGWTLPRPPSECARLAGAFTVAELNGQIIGCGALTHVGARIGEIRSVSVDQRAGRLGVGRAIMQDMLERAERQGLERLCLLTRVPEFFAKFGFVAVDATALPSLFVERAVLAVGRTFVGRTAMILERPVPLR